MQVNQRFFNPGKSDKLIILIPTNREIQVTNNFYDDTKFSTSICL